MILNAIDNKEKIIAGDEFIRNLIIQIPIQIARAVDGKFKLMYNGEGTYHYLLCFFSYPCTHISHISIYHILNTDDQTEYLSIGSVNARGLGQTIRFGAYDGLIKSWKGKIKVVTSMGKQSTGKSYMVCMFVVIALDVELNKQIWICSQLNHSFGTKFDIAGGRCTDGSWLSARILEDTLFILCDFEGLGSFERTAQEDMLLGTFNSAS